MLNRRTLRIKAMQAMFAFQRAREANFHIARDRVKEIFSFDLNSMEVQDKELLKEEQVKGLEYFDHKFDPEKKPLEALPEAHIVEKVDSIIDHYYNSVKKDRSYFREEMITEAEKIRNFYLYILSLLLEFHHISGNDKKNDHSNFRNNTVLGIFIKDVKLSGLFKKEKITWDVEKIRDWFKNILKPDETYREYDTASAPDFEADRSVLQHIVKKLIFKSETIMDHMEDMDLNWAEDRPIIRSLVNKTLKNIESDAVEVPLQEFSYNWEEDREFFLSLYDDTLSVEEKYRELIAAKAKNWDVDRIAATDKIILEMAISEMINFRSIPVKVTINEYIEVSKLYSTPKSKQFINGLLDSIAEDLTEKKIIRKSGRGLLDNK